MYNIIQVRGVQFGESQFLKVTLHLYLLLTIGYIPYVLWYILVPYFVPNDLYPILPYPYNIPPLLLSPLVTTGLFFLSLFLWVPALSFNPEL